MLVVVVMCKDMFTVAVDNDCDDLFSNYTHSIAVLQLLMWLLKSWLRVWFDRLILLLSCRRKQHEELTLIKYLGKATFHHQHYQGKQYYIITDILGDVIFVRGGGGGQWRRCVYNFFVYCD